MHLFDVSHLVTDLQGTDFVRQAQALEKFFALPETSVKESERRAVLAAGVKALETSSQPFLIAERLSRFRDEAIQPLLDLLARNPSPEVTTLAALILVNNGSLLGVPVLVAEVERGGEFITLASFALANAGITDHVPAIIEQLRHYQVTADREFPSTEDDRVLNLLDVLSKLRVPLPDDIRQKFADPQAPRFFHLAIEQHHTGGSTF